MRCHTVEVITIDDPDLRPAMLADEPAVRSCVAAAYERYAPLLGKMPALALDEYATLVASGTTHVAVVDGKVRGVLVAWVESDHLYVDNLAVDPASQGAGIGRRLLDLADRLARASQRPEVRLYTNEAMTSNLAYYLHRGFVETHRLIDDGYRRVYFSRPVAP
jgi:ribosomal protein S18 acetylase RimI-like enzyme